MSTRCMLTFLVSRGFTKFWVGQVASRSSTNRYALDLVFYWTTKTNRNVILNLVQGAYLLILHLPRLRIPLCGLLATDSPHLTAFYAPLSPAKLPVSYPFFLSSPGTNFDLTDFCHLRRRFNLFNLFVCNFWPECTNHFVGFNSVCPFAAYDMLTVGRSARDLLRKKIAP